MASLSSQQQQNKNKYANLNLNASLSGKAGGQAQPSGSGLQQGTSALTKGGLLVLSKVCHERDLGVNIVL